MNDTAKFYDLLAKAENREQIHWDDLVFLLEAAHGEERTEALFETARKLRHRYFGNRVFLYGFLYAGTHCRNDCKFCFYRSSNRLAPRYRKTEAEIVAAARELAASGVHLVDVTMGWDPAYPDRGRAGYQRLLDLVAAVRGATRLPLMISPGLVPEWVLYELPDAGATWYGCYQETHNRSLFAELRTGQNYDERMDAKIAAHRAGLLIEEGILAGVGEKPLDVARSIAAMVALDADQVRAMNFVPHRGTPMAGAAPPHPLQEPVYTAVMRLVFPERCIPASLDVDGLAGLGDRLRAGANVVTSLIPPNLGLAGVAHSRLDIDEAKRSVSAISGTLAAWDLKPASHDDYRAWLQKRRQRLPRITAPPEAPC